MTSIVVISKPLLPSGRPAKRFVLELARKVADIDQLEDREATFERP